MRPAQLSGKQIARRSLAILQVNQQIFGEAAGTFLKHSECFWWALYKKYCPYRTYGTRGSQEATIAAMIERGIFLRLSEEARALLDRQTENDHRGSIV